MGNQQDRRKLRTARMLVTLRFAEELLDAARSRTVRGVAQGRQLSLPASVETLTQLALRSCRPSGWDRWIAWCRWICRFRTLHPVASNDRGSARIAGRSRRPSPAAAVGPHA